MPPARPGLASHAAVTLLATGACDAQVGASYRGEPLATLTGTAALSGSRPRSPLDARVVWYDLLGHQQALGPEVRLDAVFPSVFRLAITTPPAAAVLNDFTFGGRFPDETRIGLGVLAAVPFAAETNVAAVAVASAHVIAWVERDVRPGTASEAFLGGPLARGFYVLAVVPSATYLATHSEPSGCAEPLDPNACPAPSGAAEGSDAWAEREACIEAARRAAGCIGPRSGVDRLAPDTGFDTQLLLAIDGAGVSLAEPSLW